MRFDWVRIEPLAVCTTMLKPYILMLYYRGRAVWTEIRISFILSWIEEVWPQLVAFFEVTPLVFHALSRHVSLFQQVVAWSLLIAERIYVNFAESHDRIAFIIYLLTLSWIYSPRKATKFLSDHSISGKILIGSIASESKNIVRVWYLYFSLRWWVYSICYFFHQRGKPHASCSHLTTNAYFLFWTRANTKTCSPVNNCGCSPGSFL